ncbi:MAG: hypothetical protein AAF624_07650 [Bacteroidota bacterium]
MDASGDFVVVWESNFQGGIYARHHDASGTPQGFEFQVNTYTTGAQGAPSVGMAASGAFVVAWDSRGQDGDFYGIHAQRYAPNGTPQGTEFQVNTYTPSSQRFPAVAIDADGDFVVVWQSRDDGTTYGIYAQRYAANGRPEGSEFRVNTRNGGSQRFPSVAMDADGNFVVTWQSGGDGSADGIYAQRYAADGTARGGEFQVNTYTTGSQVAPVAAIGTDGDFVIAWEGR